MLAWNPKPRASIAFCFILALLSLLCGSAQGKPKSARTREANAVLLLKRAQRAAEAGDARGAVRTLDEALDLCEPDDACTPRTKGRLHVTLGTIYGVIESDYAGAKREFILALMIDPDATLQSTETPELTKAFEDARREVAAQGQPGAPPPPEKPPTVTELLHPEEEPPSASSTSTSPSTTQPGPSPLPPPETGPKPRRNWFSLRAIFDFAYLGDANICSPGAPPSYYCVDEVGNPYTGTPQPNDNVTPGFAYSTTRLVLGYERVLFGGFSAGALAGYATRFASEPIGHNAFFPIHLEARVTYTFGSTPFADEARGIYPFIFFSMGEQQIESHVTIRVSEIPCGSKPEPACRRDLDAYRVIGNLFATLGGGVQVRLGGANALRAGLRTTLVFGNGGFVLSPEVGYELGL
jgi:hypothetical protein